MISAELERGRGAIIGVVVLRSTGFVGEVLQGREGWVETFLWVDVVPSGGFILVIITGIVVVVRLPLGSPVAVTIRHGAARRLIPARDILFAVKIYIGVHSPDY